MERDVIIEELIRRVTSLEAAVEDPLTHEYFTLHVRPGAPVHNAAEGVGYWDVTNDDFYINADGLNTWQLVGGGGGGAPHNWLSASHPDTTPAAPQRGDMVTGQGVAPTWTRVPHPGALKAAEFWRANVADPGWAAITNADLPSAIDVDPGTLSVATANVAATPHTHAVTSSANPGAAAAILASSAAGLLQLLGLGVGMAGAANNLRVGAGANYTQVDADGDLSFVGTADYLVANNAYAFRSAGDEDAGLYFNTAVFNSYEFRDLAGASIFTVRLSGQLDVVNSIILDDGAGDSPVVQFVGGSNDDTVTLRLLDDAIAGRSDLAVMLCDAAGQSQLRIYDSASALRAYIDSDGRAYLRGLGIGAAPVTGGIVMADGSWQGIGAALERIEFYTAGYVSVMGANLGVGTATPTQGRLVVEAGAVTTGATLYVHRDLALASTDESMAVFYNQNTGDDQVAVDIRQYADAAALKSESFGNSEAGYFYRDVSGASDPVVTIRQENAASAQPSLKVMQADDSEEFIWFDSNVGIGRPIEAVGTKTLTMTHFIRVSLLGFSMVYIPCGTIA